MKIHERHEKSRCWEIQLSSELCDSTAQSLTSGVRHAL